MAKQVIGSIPEFTQDDSNPEGIKDIHAPQEASESDAQTTDETPVEKGKDTPSVPPAENEPVAAGGNQPNVDTRDLKTELISEIEGLKDARRELIFELKDLRGEKRELKEREIEKVDEKIDTLEDVNPDDVSLIDRILNAKGYVSKRGVQQMLSESKKQDALDKFLQEYPEYSEDNDPDRKKFGPLLREVSLYKEPSDPQQWGAILRKAHRSLHGNQAPSERPAAVTKRQIEIAGVGAGGAQRSSSVKPFSFEKRMALVNGGWSEEEIQSMEARANQE